MTKPVEIIYVGSVVWDDKPPYHHWEGANITHDQYDIYSRIRDTKGLRAGLDYVLKVGK